MRVQLEELVNYLGNDFVDRKGMHLRTFETLEVIHEFTTREYGLSVIDYFFLANQLGNEGLEALSKTVGLGHSTLKRQIFRSYGLPTLDGSEYQTSRKTLPNLDLERYIRTRIEAFSTRKADEEWYREKVLEGLIEAATRLGHSPAKIEVDTTLSGAATKIFGTWNRAKQAAHLRIYSKMGTQGNYMERMRGRPTITSRIRECIKDNPSTRREIRDELNLTVKQIRVISMTPSIRYVGPKGKQIYYLQGQESFLPPEYLR